MFMNTQIPYILFFLFPIPNFEFFLLLLFVLSLLLVELCSGHPNKIGPKDEKKALQYQIVSKKSTLKPMPLCRVYL